MKGYGMYIATCHGRSWQVNQYVTLKQLVEITGEELPFDRPKQISIVPDESSIIKEDPF